MSSQRLAARLSRRRGLLNARSHHGFHRRAMATTADTERAEGDISAAFASLSGIQFKPLDQRFASMKAQLVRGHEEALVDSWTRLLDFLQEEIEVIKGRKCEIIPEIDFGDIAPTSTGFQEEVKKRGVAVVRNVLPESEALALKEDLREYLRLNPQTKSFPPGDPSVYELYWSPSQIKARSHPRLLAAQKMLMNLWHSKDPDALVSTSHPVVYADRLRMRVPGDAKFALGPHIDGGSCERWEPEGYGRGNVYDKIWQGRFEEYDPWESSCRLPVQSDLYHGVGACSAFRMLQGWLSMSNTGAFEGTLLVNPLLKEATAYFLLRPFFSPKKSIEPSSQAFLAPENWELDLTPANSWLQGATPGRGQELRPHLHPHLRLSDSMVHVPRVNPGDYVAWHCDTIHGVDSIHQGQCDATVMYIPASPMTIGNAEFLTRQRKRFLDGTPSPDFGGGVGESKHIGRPGVHDVEQVDAEDGMRAFGLKAWNSAEIGLNRGQKTLLDRANVILGF